MKIILEKVFTPEQIQQFGLVNYSALTLFQMVCNLELRRRFTEQLDAGITIFRHGVYGGYSSTSLNLPMKNNARTETQKLASKLFPTVEVDFDEPDIIFKVEDIPKIIKRDGNSGLSRFS